MGIDVITQFINGTTIMILAYVQDMKTGIAPNPAITSIKITLADPDGEIVVDSQNMSKETNLSDSNYTVYEYYYTPDLGTGESYDPTLLHKDWPIEVTATDGEGGGAKVTKGTGSFRLKESISS